MTVWESKALAIALACTAVATLTFTMLYALNVIESPVPVLIMIGLAVLIVAGMVVDMRRRARS